MCIRDSYETECYFPTWINKENAAHVQAVVDAHHALWGDERIGPESAMSLRHRPLIDKWTFSTNGVAIQGRYGIPCVGFGPGAESQAHAPNAVSYTHLPAAPAPGAAIRNPRTQSAPCSG